MIAPPDFEALNEVLAAQDCTAGPAELQGSLCAQLTVSDEVSFSAWLDLAFGDDPPDGRLDAMAGQALQDLYAWTRERLEDGELGFKLFLPDDDLSLNLRTEALSHWCQGYLSGLGLSGISKESGLPDDAREFLEDLSQIARAEFVSEEGDEGDEVAFMELVEYARVGAMLVYETLRGPGPSESVH